MSKKKLLHIGSGAARILGMHGFSPEEWNETRLDIDPAAQPDITASMASMPNVPDNSFDAVFSSHNLEHLEAHEVPRALREFLRVLAPDGYLVLTLPDLQSVCQLVADDKLMDTAYIAPAGPITPLDILYGHRASLDRGMTHMAHRTGFTRKTLQKTLADAGFGSVVIRRGRDLALYAIASKKLRGPRDIMELFDLHWSKGRKTK